MVFYLTWRQGTKEFEQLSPDAAATVQDKRIQLWQPRAQRLGKRRVHRARGHEGGKVRQRFPPLRVGLCSQQRHVVPELASRRRRSNSQRLLIEYDRCTGKSVLPGGFPWSSHTFGSEARLCMICSLWLRFTDLQLRFL